MSECAFFSRCLAFFILSTQTRYTRCARIRHSHSLPGADPFNEFPYCPRESRNTRMKITPPFGYDEIVPLQKQHRVLLPAGSTPAFCRNINALAVSVSEFATAGRDYPIVFISLDQGSTFAPVIVLGLAAGSNLFLGENGDWDVACYLPAFVRRYPFCISKLYVDGEPKGERLVCVAKAYLDPAGVSLFDEAENPTPQWQSVERLLSEYEADLDLTTQMCVAFSRMHLFEPFTMQVMRQDAPEVKLAGMYRIDATRLNDLKPANHKIMVAKGYMGCVYAHLHSLQNFARLYAREATRTSNTAPSYSDSLR